MYRSTLLPNTSTPIIKPGHTIPPFLLSYYRTHEPNTLPVFPIHPCPQSSQATCLLLPSDYLSPWAYHFTLHTHTSIPTIKPGHMTTPFLTSDYPTPQSLLHGAGGGGGVSRENYHGHRLSPIFCSLPSNWNIGFYYLTSLHIYVPFFSLLQIMFILPLCINFLLNFFTN